MLCTDGITEPCNLEEEEFGSERLADCVSRNRHKTAEQIIEAVHEEVNAFSFGGVHTDDKVLMLLKVTAGGIDSATLRHNSLTTRHRGIRARESPCLRASGLAVISATTSEAPGFKYPLRRNQSSIAVFRRSSGTRAPISMTPSAVGSVSSKTWSLVKLRMAKLSSHFSGAAWRRPWDSYSTRIFRANIVVSRQWSVASVNPHPVSPKSGETRVGQPATPYHV